MSMRDFMGWGRLTAASVAALLAVAPPALAADQMADQSAVESMFDIAFGVDLTSDYISRGYTQTDHNPAVQPWVELDYGIFYAGYWGSNTDLSTIGGNWEHDLSIGVRPEVGPFSFDFGYVRYLYDTGDCCGELYALASVNPVDPLTLGAAVYYDPDAASTYVESNASFDLPHDISVSAAVGSWDGEFSWNAGASWSPLDWLSADLRYYGGPEANRVVFTLSVESSLSALRGN